LIFQIHLLTNFSSWNLNNWSLNLSLILNNWFWIHSWYFNFLSDQITIAFSWCKRVLKWSAFPNLVYISNYYPIWLLIFRHIQIIIYHENISITKKRNNFDWTHPLFWKVEPRTIWNLEILNIFWNYCILMIFLVNDNNNWGEIDSRWKTFKTWSCLTKGLKSAIKIVFRLFWA
jgi:hypothetical protein